MKYFIYAIIGIVIFTVIAGFFIVGSPANERARKFDEQRINDLQTIQWQILNYWQTKNKLPQDLANLQDDISGFSIPRDSDSNATSSYLYSVKGVETFSLCAVFSTSNMDDPNFEGPSPIGYRSWGDNWKHNVGQTCFERTIDKDLYKKQ